MADYVLIRKSRNIISTILHIFLNILLGIGSILLTTITGSWVLGAILVVISKWRVFAVRPRYWLLNLKSSLVDFIVGLSFVFIAYCAGTEDFMLIHYILAVLYTAWLIFVKPRSSEIAAEIQSLVATFLGVTAVTLLVANLHPAIMVVAAAGIGFAASRHVLIQSDDNNFALVTYICGLIFAEISWLCQSWLIVYSFRGTGIVVPQLSIILTLFMFAFTRTYKTLISREDKTTLKDVAAPIIFSIIIILIMLIWFSKPIFDYA